MAYKERNRYQDKLQILLNKTVMILFVFLFQLPTRFNDDRGQYDHAYSGGGGGGGLHRHEKRHHHSHHHSNRALDSDGIDGYGNSASNSTINSRKSLRSSNKKRQRKCGLALLLLLGALLVAFGIGLLVYYLLLECKYLSIRIIYRNGYEIHVFWYFQHYNNNNSCQKAPIALHSTGRLYCNLWRKRVIKSL